MQKSQVLFADYIEEKGTLLCRGLRTSGEVDETLCCGEGQRARKCSGPFRAISSQAKYSCLLHCIVIVDAIHSKKKYARITGVSNVCFIIAENVSRHSTVGGNIRRCYGTEEEGLHFPYLLLHVTLCFSYRYAHNLRVPLSLAKNSVYRQDSRGN